MRCSPLPSSLLTAGCERPPVDTVQRGYRGLGMEEVYNPRTLATQAALNVAPAAAPAAAPGGPPATDGVQERAGAERPRASTSSRG